MFSVLLIAAFLGGVNHQRTQGLITAEHKLIGLEIALEQPPVWFIDDCKHLHYLAYIKENYLEYSILDQTGARLDGFKIKLMEGRLDYFKAIGPVGDGVEFLLVLNQQGEYRPYILNINNHEYNYRQLNFTVPQQSDLDIVYSGGYYYLAFVQKTTTGYELLAQRIDNDEILEQTISLADRHLHQPRLYLDQKGLLHLAWKENRGALGFVKYNVLEADFSKLLNADHLELGPAAFHFGDRFGQPLPFQQDIGPDLIQDINGNMLVTFSFASWHTTFNILEADLKIVEIANGKEIVKTSKITGIDNFALFGNIAINEKGTKSLIYEDFTDQSFNLYYLKADNFDSFNQVQQLKPAFASNRLVKSEWLKDDLIVTYRQFSGAKDSIYFLNSAEADTEKFYDYWGLWFFRSDFSNILREGFFMILLSVVGAAFFTARNFVLLLIFALLLYLLQKNNLLLRFNFVFVFTIMIIISYIFKMNLELLYASPAVNEHFQFFSTVFSFLIVFTAAQKVWLSKVDELTYLAYVLFFFFSDAFLSFLVYVPVIFSP